MHGSLLIAEFGGALPRVAMPFIDARLQHTFTYEALAWAWVAAMNVAVAAIGGYLMSVVREREAALSEMVVTDSETGLRNRKYFFHRLGGEVARCRQFGRLVSVLVIDIDRFKNYNDLHGHAAGDRLLQSLAGILTTAVHRHETAAADSDVEVVCRTSSGEFAIILPEAATAEGKSVAERVRQHAQEMLATQSAEKIRSRVSRYVTDRQGITLSVGVATYTTDVRNADELVVRARAALAKAKASGGDKVGAWVDELELIA
jgi:diguanylate cyclase (GGDEF)-like protein